MVFQELVSCERGVRPEVRLARTIDQILDKQTLSERVPGRPAIERNTLASPSVAVVATLLLLVALVAGRLVVLANLLHR
jgi:hypothetical protein